MPVYNGSKHIEYAIKSLQAQTYQNWKLLVSDNCSTDNTFEICQNLAKTDKRISVIKQSKNIGAVENFQFVLSKANADFFMWAACDDYWAPTFIEKCADELSKNTEIGMVFCNLFTMNFGNSKKLLPYEFLYLQGKANFKTIGKYIIDQEKNGKANLIYSLYRSRIIKSSWNKTPLTNIWGADMLFTISAIANSGIKIVPEYLFHKRQLPPIQKQTNIKEKLSQKIKFFFEFVNFLSKIPKTLKSTKFYILSYFADL
jgi:glycosyltransferase involved in cell wall biosynthesis